MLEYFCNFTSLVGQNKYYITLNHNWCTCTVWFAPGLVDFVHHLNTGWTWRWCWAHVTRFIPSCTGRPGSITNIIKGDCFRRSDSLIQPCKRYSWSPTCYILVGRWGTPGFRRDGVGSVKASPGTMGGGRLLLLLLGITLLAWRTILGIMNFRRSTIMGGPRV